MHSRTLKLIALALALVLVTPTLAFAAKPAPTPTPTPTAPTISVTAQFAATNPGHVRYAPNQNRMFVSDGTRVLAFDAKRKRQVGAVDVALVQSMDVDTTRNRLWVINCDTPAGGTQQWELLEIDATTLAILSRTPAPRRISQLAVDTVRGLVYGADFGNEWFVFDSANGSVAAMPVPPMPEYATPQCFALNYDSVNDDVLLSAYWYTIIPGGTTYSSYTSVLSIDPVSKQVQYRSNPIPAYWYSAEFMPSAKLLLVPAQFFIPLYINSGTSLDNALSLNLIATQPRGIRHALAANNLTGEVWAGDTGAGLITYYPSWKATEGVYTRPAATYALPTGSVPGQMDVCEATGEVWTTANGTDTRIYVTKAVVR